MALMSKGVFRQLIATLIISCAGINMGIMFAWPAFTLKLFGSNDTPLNRPMTEIEISLFSSLSSVGAMVSTLSAGVMLDKVGRKKCSVFNAVIITLVWVILICAYNVEAVLTAMFLAGVSSSVFLVGGVYISEVSQDSIRGSMTAINMVAFGFGMLLSYLLGGYLQYTEMLYVGLSLTAAGIVVLYFVKDSPVYLMSSKREKEAIQVLSYYRGIDPSSKQFMEELNGLKRAINPELEDSPVLSPEEEQLKGNGKPPQTQQNQKLSTWQFFKKSSSTRRATFVSIALMTFSIFQGVVILMIYAEKLFTEAMPEVSTTISTVILAAILVVAGIVTAYLTEKAGRKGLMIYSSVGSGICCVILGTQLQLHWGPNWLTAVLIYVDCVVYTFGAGTIPYVLIAEIFLPEVRSMLSMVVVEWAWVCNFIILFIANPMVTSLGWGPVFYIFAGICFLTAVFSIMFLPETKGQTLEEIQLLFTKKRKAPDMY